MPPVNARHTIININPTTSLPHILQVLIFSQMVKMIDFIDEFCEFRKYPCERLDGRIAGNERQKSIDRCVHLYLWFGALFVCPICWSPRSLSQAGQVSYTTAATYFVV
jgi:hypothetical protein